jgi:hypothetical protein
MKLNGIDLVVWHLVSIVESLGKSVSPHVFGEDNKDAFNLSGNNKVLDPVITSLER